MAATIVPVIGADSATYTISTMDQLLAVGVNVTSALNVTSAISVAGSSVNVTNTVFTTSHVTGTVAISGVSGSSINVTNTVAVSGASANVTGTITITGSVNANVTNTVAVSGASANVTGTITVTGSVNSNVTNTVNIAPGSAQTTVSTVPLIRVGVIDSSGNQVSSFGGTANITGTVTITGVSGSTIAATGTVTISGVSGSSVNVTNTVNVVDRAYYTAIAANKSVDPGTQYKFCASGATTALGTGTSTGTIGDYLGILNCCVTTASVGTVQIIDGTLTMNVLPLQVNAGGYVIPFGVTSAIGGWKVLTTSAVSVIACGKFT